MTPAEILPALFKRYTEPALRETGKTGEYGVTQSGLWLRYEPTDRGTQILHVHRSGHEACSEDSWFTSLLSIGFARQPTIEQCYKHNCVFVREGLDVVVHRTAFNPRFEGIDVIARVMAFFAEFTQAAAELDAATIQDRPIVCEREGHPIAVGVGA